MTQNWQQMGEEPLTLYGLQLGEFNRIEQYLRQERDRLSHELEARQREMALLAQQAWHLLYEKAEDIQRMERRRRMTRAGLEVVVACGEGQTGDALLGRLLDTVLEATGAGAAAVYTLREEILKLMAAKGLHAEVFTDMAALRLGEGISGVAAERNEPVVTTEPPEGLPLLRAGTGQAGFAWFAAIPLLAGEELVGAVQLLSASPLPVAAPELQVLTGLGSLLRASLASWEESKGLGRLLPPT